jgi:hypothetical protein
LFGAKADRSIVRTIAISLAEVSRRVEDAARSLGATNRTMLFEITFPLIKGGLCGVLNRTSLPSDIIAFVVFCRLRYGLTLRDLSEILLLRGVEVSHEAVRDSEVKLGAGHATGRIARFVAQTGNIDRGIPIGLYFDCADGGSNRNKGLEAICRR